MVFELPLLLVNYCIVERMYFGNILGRVKAYDVSPRGNPYTPKVFLVSIIHGALCWMIFPLSVALLTAIVYTLLFLWKQKQYIQRAFDIRTVKAGEQYLLFGQILMILYYTALYITMPFFFKSL